MASRPSGSFPRKWPQRDWSHLQLDLYPKRLELLKAALPKVTRVVSLGSTFGVEAAKLAAIRTPQEAAAQALGMTLLRIEINALSDFANATVAIVRDHPDALVLAPTPVNFALRREIAEFAIAQRLPAIGANRDQSVAGILMSYGPDRLATPVIFPPGRARLVTNPAPTGSPTPAITIGIVAVASFAAAVAGVLVLTMTSTLRRTSSAASAGNRSSLPSEEASLDDEIFPFDVTTLLQRQHECFVNAGDSRVDERYSSKIANPPDPVCLLRRGV